MIQSALSVTFVALFTLGAVASEHANLETITGRATVIDGDTLNIRGEYIRINGVDAPESAQLCKDAKGRSYRCGATVAKALAEFLAASSPTRCAYVTRDKYSRFVGTQAADGLKSTNLARRIAEGDRCAEGGGALPTSNQISCFTP